MDEFVELPQHEPAWQARDRIAAYRKALLSSGYQPLPCTGKKVLVSGWSQILATNDIINKWADQCPDALNTGLLTATTPAIDIDVTDEEVAEEIEVLVEDMLGKSAVRIGRAPRRAILFKADAPFAKLVANFVAPNGTTHKVEVLAQGQQIVVNGIHPDTQQPYRWHGGEPGPDLKRADLPLLTAEKAAAFIAAVAELMTNRGWTAATDRNPNSGTTGATDRGASHTGASVRERAYAEAALAGCAADLANTAEGSRNDVLNAKAFRLGTMVARGWITRGHVISGLLAAAHACGLDDIEATQTCRSGLRAGGQQPHPELERDGTRARVRAQTIDDGSFTEPEWPEPKPLPAGLLPVDAFTPDFMPAALGPWIEDAANRMQCAPDFVGISTMVATGALIGRRVGIRPQRKTDWVETANLWGCIVGRPGLLKSPAMNEALRPLRRLEVEACKQNKERQKDYDQELEHYKVKRETAVKAFQKGTAAAIDVEKPEEPLARRYLTNDTSYQALGAIHVANPNGVLVVRDELVSLLKTLDRDENAADRGFYLTAWNGTQPYTFDRIGRGHCHIDAACLSILGSTQPGRIAEYVRRAVRGSEGDDGLVQRFGMFVHPDTPRTWKDVDTFPDSAARKAAYEVFLRLDKVKPQEIGAETVEFDDLPFLRFDDAAQDEFRGWRYDLEKRMRSEDMPPALEGHFAKYRKLVPALSLINHLADNGTGPVTLVATLKALALVKYLESHAYRIYGASTATERTAATAILARVRKGDLKDGFSARDVYRPQWSGLTDREHIHLGLDLLVDYDHLAEHHIASGAIGGRPTMQYTINPKTMS
jgi:Protein of unknown function (DUF3987)/Bifunctional DNA primase/polymerase, N-terminal